ncbi:MAG: ribosome recycling factor [Oscillospiraceae bacterium]|nr:ribosome recycling factor [Candidatus Equicaccousia limihippi]
MEQLLKDTEEKMVKAIDALSRDYAEIRAGRANPKVLDRVMVDYYGTPTPIQQVAAISVPEGRVLQIQPWDATLVKDIEKAIQASDIGINPQNDGRIIRLTFPQLTEERRKELCKGISKRGEDAKIAVRNVRRDAVEKAKTMKKNNEITEDDLSSLEKKIQNLTDKYCDSAEKASNEKEQDIMKI